MKEKMYIPEKIKIRSEPSFFYNNTLVYMALASLPNNRNMAKTRGWYHCREQLTSELSQQVMKRARLKNQLKAVKAGKLNVANKAHAERALRYTIPVDTAGVALHFSTYYTFEAVSKRLAAAEKILNIIEEFAGERQLTKIHKINAKNIWIAYGPSIWVKSPHLFSLYLLLLRTLGTSNKLTKVYSFEQLEKVIDSGKITHKEKNVREDLEFLFELGQKKLRTLLKNHKRIYWGRTQQVNFDVRKFNSGWGGYIGQEGISKMVKGQGRDTKAAKRFSKIWQGI